MNDGKKRPGAGGMVVAALLAMASPAAAASVTVRIESVQVAPAMVATIPIAVEGAQGMGSLQLDLVYDPALLEPAESAVEASDALPGCMVEWNVVEPGRLRVAMISGEPVQGATEILVARFLAAEPGGRSCPLELNNVRAWDHENNLEMLVNAESGTLAIAAVGPPLPVMGGIAALALVILAGVVVIVLRRRGGEVAGR